MDAAYDLLEARTGTTFPPGYNPHIRTIRLTLDPIPARARPLLLYTLTGAFNTVLDLRYLRSLGMKRVRAPSGHLDVLVRVPPGWTAQVSGQRPPPVLYLHGLGFGLMQNANVIKALLQKLPDHPIVVPLAHHTAQTFLHPRHLRPWKRRAFVNDVREIGEELELWGAGHGGMSVLSHSNGSVAHGWCKSSLSFSLCPGHV